ncbi:hypothetical protein Tco_0473070 [Tanacetum coccineum]
MNKTVEAETSVLVKARLAFSVSGASASNSTQVKNKGLITKTYEWDEEEVSSDENEVDEVKVLMALTDDERVAVGKESAKNGEWVKISMKKVHTLLEMEDNDDRKYFLDYLCIDLNYVEEQRNNILSKHRDIVHELNTCKEQLIVLKQAKLDFLTMQHVNTEILKKNQNLRKELKELTNITETWFDSYNKVNQCISEQIPTQKKRILRVDQHTEDPSSSGQKDVVFVKSSADDTKVSTPESQVNTTDPPAAVTNSSATEYDSADESSVCSTPLPPLEKLAGAEPVFGPKTIKSILKSNYTFKAEALKGVTINEPSSAPAKAKASTSKTNSAPTGKLKNVKTKDDLPLASVMKELNLHVLLMKCLSVQKSSDHLSNDCVNYPICDICGSYDHDTHGHNKIISLRRGINPRNPQHAIKSCETCGSTVHTTTDHNDNEWFRRGEALQAKKAKTLKSKKTKSSNANRTKTPTKRHITGVKSYLHKYVEQLGSKVVFGDDSTSTTEGYGSIKCYSGEIEAKGTLKKGLLPPRWRLLMAQIIQSLGGKTGGFDQISNKDAIIMYCLANGVDIDYAKLIWEDIINKLKKKTIEKIIPYLRFLSLLLEHKMEGYGNDDVTLNPTQIFIVHNWALKKNQPEGPHFTTHMLAICNAVEHVAFKAPKISSKDEKKVPQGTKPGAKTGRRRKHTSSLTKQNPLSKFVVTKASTTKHVYSTSTILHSEYASGHDALADSTAEADPGKSAPNDSVSQQQGIEKGTQNYLFDHFIAGTNLSVLVDKTKSVGDGLKTGHTITGTDKDTSNAEKEVSFDQDEFNTFPDLSNSDDATKEIKLEDLSKLVKNVDADFMDLDSPDDDGPIIVQDEEEEEELHAE